MYSDDELLLISGIQHFYYCRRQWSLIHIEQQWDDNLYTRKGEIMHEKVDNPFILESRGNMFVSRSVPLVSYELGFYGVSDAVEFVEDVNGIFLPFRDGCYRIVPIEYKVGKPKNDNCDIVQLCIQAICLESMLGGRIEEGYLYYGKTRHRQKVDFTDELRKEVFDISRQMHEILFNDCKVAAKYSDKCIHCSLYNICVPKIKSKYKSVSKYIEQCFKEDGE